MRVRALVSTPALLTMLIVGGGCVFPIPPFFPFDPGFPPMGEGTILIDNRSDQDYVLVMRGDFPATFAVPSSTMGEAMLFGSDPTSLELQDRDCQPIDEIEWRDGSTAVRIEADGSLALLDEQPSGEAETPPLNEYFECGFFGGSPQAGDPAPHLDGRLLAIGEDGAPWSIDPTTAELTQVGAIAPDTFDAEHAWSPDGSMLAFSRMDETGADSGIWVANADGSGGRLLLEEAGSPIWSPDGSRIAGVTIDPFAPTAALVVVDVEDGDAITLAADAWSPRWSPDGSQIAYIEGVDMDWMGPPDTVEALLAVVDADVGEPRMIAEASPIGDAPAWSPDGEWIAFSTGDGTVGTIDLVRPDGSDRRTLVDLDETQPREPIWSPDGERVAYVADKTSFFSMTSIVGFTSLDPEGAVFHSGSSDAMHYSPRWSPDGSHLAATRMPMTSVTSELVVFDPDSGDTQILATGIMTLIEWRP